MSNRPRLFIPGQNGGMPEMPAPGILVAAPFTDSQVLFLMAAMVGATNPASAAKEAIGRFAHLMAAMKAGRVQSTVDEVAKLYEPTVEGATDGAPD